MLINFLVYTLECTEYLTFLLFAQKLPSKIGYFSKIDAIFPYCHDCLNISIQIWAYRPTVNITGYLVQQQVYFNCTPIIGVHETHLYLFYILNSGQIISS